MAQRTLVPFAGALLILAACSERQAPAVTLMLSDDVVRVGTEFEATISVTDANRELCLYTLPQESFFWMSSAMGDRLSPPFVLPDRHSEIECRDPGEAYTYQVSLLLSDVRGRYVLSMNGVDIGEFDSEEIDLGVSVHPANEPSGSSHEGYANWPREILKLETLASEQPR